MNPFRSYTFHWWQIGIFKVALLALGAAAGAWWHPFFRANLVPLLVVGGVASAYVAVVALGQKE